MKTHRENNNAIIKLCLMFYNRFTIFFAKMCFMKNNFYLYNFNFSNPPTSPFYIPSETRRVLAMTFLCVF